MIKPGIEKDGNKSVLIGVFNSGHVIALLLFLAGSIGSLCDGVIASRGLGVAELAAIGIVYPYTKKHGMYFPFVFKRFTGYRGKKDRSE